MDNNLNIDEIVFDISNIKINSPETIVTNNTSSFVENHEHNIYKGDSHISMQDIRTEEHFHFSETIHEGDTSIFETVIPETSEPGFDYLPEMLVTGMVLQNLHSIAKEHPASYTILGAVFCAILIEVIT